jgi:hypothetical protein
MLGLARAGMWRVISGGVFPFEAALGWFFGLFPPKDAACTMPRTPC